jgi:hypothetical protein
LLGDKKACNASHENRSMPEVRPNPNVTCQSLSILLMSKISNLFQIETLYFYIIFLEN